MIKKVGDIPQESFKGLNTISDFFAITKEQTPNAMNVKFNFDGSVQKRQGCKQMNSTAIVSQAGSGFTVDSSGTLTTNLVSYWKLNETNSAAIRTDLVNINHFTPIGSAVSSAIGKLGSCSVFFLDGSAFLRASHDASLLVGNSNFSVALWCKVTDSTIRNATRNTMIMCKGSDTKGTLEWKLWYRGSDNRPMFTVSANGSDSLSAVCSAPVIMAHTAWYCLMAGKSSNNIWVQEGTGTISIVSWNSSLITTGNSDLQIALSDTASTAGYYVWGGAIDEVGFWMKYLSAQERTDLRN